MTREPSYIRNFKAATNRPFEISDLDLLEAETYGASDRTCVITLMAALEGLFERYVRSVLRKDLNSDDKRALFDHGGPLGNFSSQISLAYALGLIGPETRDIMTILRIIRNGAAHSRQNFSFDADYMIAICDKIQLNDRVVPGTWFKMVIGKDPEIGDTFDDKSAKTNFICAVHTICLYILKPKEPKRVAMVIPYHLP